MNPAVLRLSALSALTISLALAGCNSTARLDLSPPASKSEPVRREAKTGAVIVEFATTKDCRLDPEALGSVAGRRFDGDNAGPWIDAGLKTLDSAYYTVRTDPRHPPATITAHPTLLKLYVDSVAITKTAVVVIQLDFDLPGNRTATRFYRGQYAGMNWGSGAGEMTSALHLALDDCLKKISQALELQEYHLGATERPGNTESTQVAVSK